MNTLRDAQLRELELIFKNVLNDAPFKAKFEGIFYNQASFAKYCMNKLEDAEISLMLDMMESNNAQTIPNSKVE